MFVIVRTIYEGYEEVLAVTQDESLAQRALEFMEDESLEVLSIPEISGFYSLFRVMWTRSETTITPFKALSQDEYVSEEPGCKIAIVATHERAQELLEEWNNA